ncbi:subtilisin-like protein [Auriculariales sp. MPI-PUGE-AT-0066]|nr:subtilisin-like protein [Auriculariales sp. MPI-PUGE-AT-0066]
MHWTIATSLLLAAAGPINGATIKNHQEETNKSLPGGYVAQQDFLGSLDKRVNGEYVVRTKYASELYNGVSIQFKAFDPLRLPAVIDFKSYPNVVAVHPIVVIPKSERTVKPTVLKEPDENRLNVHTLTGVDKAHAAGITGKGIKIAMVDSGVDYTLAPLGGGFGPGFKVSGGYDFLGPDWLFGPLQPDDDPIEDACNGGYGTEVAGVIGASPEATYNLTGVAYDAELLSYKVFGCYRASYNDVIIDGILRAYDDGADIINIATTWWESYTEIYDVAQRVAEAGRVVVAHGGQLLRDSGGFGLMRIPSPGTASGVIAVGSVNNIVTSVATLTTSVEHDPILYDIASYPNFPGVPIQLPQESYPVFALTKSADEINTACNPLGDDVPDLSQYAVIVRLNMTECDSWWQAYYLSQKGAQLVIYFDVSEPEFFESPENFAAVLLRSHDDAAFLIEQATTIANFTVSFPQSITNVPNLETGGLVSSFSSYGLTRYMQFKPNIVAPGGNITAIVPPSVGLGLWYLDGSTELSAAYISGVAALLLQSKGKDIAPRVREILQSTAVSVPISREANSKLESLAHQGAGLVNAFSAISLRTTISPTELSLNDTAHWNGRHTITIKNDADAAQTYQIRHIPAVTVETKPKDSADWNIDTLPVVDATAVVSFGDDSITVQAGSSANITIEISAPDGVEPLTFPVLSGWVKLSGSLGDSVQVSYMGVVGNWKSSQIISSPNEMNPTLGAWEGGLPAIMPWEDPLAPQLSPRNYTLDDSAWPYFLAVLSTPSEYAVLDLVPADTEVKTNVPHPENAGGSSKAARTVPLARRGTFDEVPILGRLNEWLISERDAGINNIGAASWHGLDIPSTFTNGTAIPFGQYRLLLRALRLLGDRADQNDYDVYVSQQFGIVEAA